MSKKEYNKLHKDATRIVIYAKPATKSGLAQHAVDKGVSLSALCVPKMEELLDTLDRNKEHGEET